MYNSAYFSLASVMIACLDVPFPMPHLLPHHPMQKIQSLESEINIYKSLRHERIVPYFDTVQREAVFYIFMEYMPGVSYGSCTLHLSTRLCAR